MQPTAPFEAWLADEPSTLALGAALARSLPQGVGRIADHGADHGAGRTVGARVLALEGPLGAGKTTLARGLLRALGATGPVKSPSYTLLEPYDLPPWQVLHLDLYRLVDPAELEGLGLRDEWQAGRLWLVEWPGRGVGHLPPADLKVTLAEPDDKAPVETQGDDAVARQGRHLRIEAGTPAGASWLATLATLWPVIRL